MEWVVFWKAFVDDVQKFSSKVISEVLVERRVVPCYVSCSFSFVFSELSLVGGCMLTCGRIRFLLELSGKGQ